MKKIVFLALLLVCVLTTKGQQQFSYTYDAAGNRISRTIVSNISPSLGRYTIQLKKKTRNRKQGKDQPVARRIQ